MRFAFKTSPQNSTWSQMLPVCKAADDIDVFESGFTFDYFYPVTGGPPAALAWMEPLAPPVRQRVGQRPHR